MESPNARLLLSPDISARHGNKAVPAIGVPSGEYFNKKPSMKAYFILLLAIILETIATSFLKQSEQFTRLFPSVITIAAYAASFYCLSLVLKNIPVGIAYAIWSGMGIVLISAIGWLVFKQHLDLPAISGLALIIAGVLVINIFSNSVPH